MATTSRRRRTWDQLADIDEFFHRPPDLYGGWMSGVNWGIGLDYQTILFGVGGRAFDLEANDAPRQQPGERQDLRDHATHRQDGAGELRHPELLRRRHVDAGRQARLLYQLFLHLGDARQGARQVRHDRAAGQRHPDRHVLLRRSRDGAERRLRGEVHRLDAVGRLSGKAGRPRPAIRRRPFRR